MKKSSTIIIRAIVTIKYCAKTSVALFVAAEVYLSIVRPGDDIAGGVFMGLLGIVASGVIAIAAGRLEKIYGNHN